MAPEAGKGRVVMKRLSHWVGMVAVGGLLLLGGCKDDEITSPPDTPPPVGSPAQLMANFQAVTEGLDIDGYREVLDPEFAIYLSQGTIDEYSLPREFFDYDEDMLISERMFSGNAITRPNGDIIPGITGITFNVCQAEAAWAVAPEDHRFAGALWAPFRVDLTVEQGNEGRMTIKGIIEFYLSSEPVDYQGSTIQNYRMVGQVDYTASRWAKRPAEDTAWGDLKALYR